MGLYEVLYRKHSALVNWNTIVIKEISYPESKLLVYAFDWESNQALI